MKRILMKPGFEFIFALSLIAIMALPPLVFGQTPKDIEIKIENGDTTVNGKNIKDLPAQERTSALKDINSITHKNIIRLNAPGGMTFFQKPDSGKQRLFIERQQFDAGKPGMMHGEVFYGDSVHGKFRFRFRNADSAFMQDHFDRFTSDMAPSFDGPEFKFRRNFKWHGFGRRNMQEFNYTNVGSDGIETHVNFNVADTREERINERKGKKDVILQLTDLSIVPEFSSGKTILMFNLPAKTVATVQLTDNDHKVLWTEKSAGSSFSKKFTLGLNGVYFLKVKQGDKEVEKRIVKE